MENWLQVESTLGLTNPQVFAVNRAKQGLSPENPIHLKFLRSLNMETAVYILMAVVLMMYFYKKVAAGVKRGLIANNIVAAYATFQTLDEATRQTVVKKVESIIRRSSWPKGEPITFPTDVARWGWYALAMRELAIQPVCLTPSWAIISNPFTAMLTTDTMIDTSIKDAERFGHRIKIDRSPGLFELMIGGFMPKTSDKLDSHTPAILFSDRAFLMRWVDFSDELTPRQEEIISTTVQIADLIATQVQIQIIVDVGNDTIIPKERRPYAFGYAYELAKEYSPRILPDSPEQELALQMSALCILFGASTNERSINAELLNYIQNEEEDFLLARSSCKRFMESRK